MIGKTLRVPSQLVPSLAITYHCRLWLVYFGIIHLGHGVAKSGFAEESSSRGINWTDNLLIETTRDSPLCHFVLPFPLWLTDGSCWSADPGRLRFPLVARLKRLYKTLLF